MSNRRIFGAVIPRLERQGSQGFEQPFPINRLEIILGLPITQPVPSSRAGKDLDRSGDLFPSTAVMRRNPPVNRAVNWLLAVDPIEGIRPFSMTLSANRKVPT